MPSIFFFYSNFGICALRLALGAIVVAHGWPKIKDLKRTAASFDGMGFKPGVFWGTAVALLETAGGIALIFGILSGAFASLFVLQFATIIVWKLTRRQPFVGGWEFDLLILAAAIVIVLNGGGPYSLGRAFFIGW